MEKTKELSEVFRRNLHNHIATHNQFTTQVRCSCRGFDDVRRYRTFDDWVNHVVDLAMSDLNGEGNG